MVTYGVVLGFAIYRVFLFAKNKDLKGVTRKVTLSFMIIVLFVILISLTIIKNYEWNDTIDYWWNEISVKNKNSFGGVNQINTNIK